jgi:hypothetical protein
MKARLGTEVRPGNAFANPLFETHAEAGAFLQAQHPRLQVGLGLAIKEHLASGAPAQA